MFRKGALVLIYIIRHDQSMSAQWLPVQKEPVILDFKSGQLTEKCHPEQQIAGVSFDDNAANVADHIVADGDFIDHDRGDTRDAVGGITRPE